MTSWCLRSLKSFQTASSRSQHIQNFVFRQAVARRRQIPQAAFYQHRAMIGVARQPVEERVDDARDALAERAGTPRPYTTSRDGSLPPPASNTAAGRSVRNAPSTASRCHGLSVRRASRKPPFTS